jgi:hypothetical protein
MNNELERMWKVEFVAGGNIWHCMATQRKTMKIVNQANHVMDEVQTRHLLNTG